MIILFATMRTLGPFILRSLRGTSELKPAAPSLLQAGRLCGDANSGPVPSYGPTYQHCTAAAPSDETITVTFVDKNGNDVTVQAPVGKNLLEIAHDNEIELEGACEGSLACSTCHLIVENDEYYHKIPEPTEDELDMLDLAFGLTETSRLGCQVIASKEMDGIRVRLPAATR